jgi:PTS system mannose-specific IIB component
MTSHPLRALIVTHGRLGESLIESAAGIAGTVAGVQALSNERLSPDEMQRRITAWLAEEPNAALSVIFVDLAGGSCCSASLRVARGRPATAVVSGVNLPMLLEFLQYREALPVAELLERLESRGRRSVALMASPDTARLPT